MKWHERAVLAILLLWGLGAAARAEDLPQYDVEVLVFASLYADDAQEAWPPLERAPATDAALPFLEGNGIRPLDGPRNLQAIADAMRRSSGYRPLLHWRWRQPGWERGQALPVRVLAAAADGQPLLDGTLTLARSRYLHLSADLVYADPTVGVPVALREARRMRSGELHYLDHPRFGVLVQVNPAARD
ncbi:MAG: peptidoglycan binding protein CsiV [Gammaproteobacteria bacterium]|nr:peptidoglycan binding protein CsiV [Gammaproteobacteria bacterium]